MYGGFFKLTDGDLGRLYLELLVIICFYLFVYLFVNKKINERYIKNLLYISLILHLIILLIENYFFIINNQDPIHFEEWAWQGAMLNKSLGLTYYEKIVLRFIYTIIRIRMPVVFILLNILFSLLSALNLFEILIFLKKKNKNIKYKTIKCIMAIYLLSPISILFKTSILREALIILFLSISLKKIIFYYYLNKKKYFYESYIYILIATIFHSGMIVVSFGYILLYFFKTKNRKKIFSILGIIILFIVIYIFRDILVLKKIGNKGLINRIIQVQNIDTLKNAGSAYMVNISPKTFGEVIKYLPLKMFYFLYSPTPNMFRNIFDIFVFLCNSLIYMWLTFSIIKSILFSKLSKKMRLLVYSLSLSLLLGILVYSLGTQNAGTAMRHRDKFLILFFIIYVICPRKNKTEKKR